MLSKQSKKFPLYRFDCPVVLPGSPEDRVVLEEDPAHWRGLQQQLTASQVTVVEGRLQPQTD